MATRPGPTNPLTDVRGIRVGHATRIGDGWLLLGSRYTISLSPDHLTILGPPTVDPAAGERVGEFAAALRETAA